MSVSLFGSPATLAKLASRPDSNVHDSRKRSMRYLLELQTEMAAEALMPSENASAKATCARVWKDLEELRLTLIGFGRPKPVEAKNTRSKSKSRTAPAMVDPTDHGHQPETPDPEVPNS